MENSGSGTQPMGIIESIADAVRKTNERLDHVESKLDRIWEIVSSLPGQNNEVPAARANHQLGLFDEAYEDQENGTPKYEAPEALRFEPDGDAADEDEREALFEAPTPSYSAIEFEDDFSEEASDHENNLEENPDEDIFDMTPDDDDDMMEAPHWQDKPAYKEYTAALISEMRDAGMPLKVIADELTEMGLKTRTGKNKWSFGSVASILKQIQD